MNHSCKLCDEFISKKNVICEFKHCFLMFNRFPYLPGHIMLVPKRPCAKLSEYNSEERLEIFNVLHRAQDILMETLEIDSTNIGINTGPNSGASIPTHLHIHIIPRKKNDMNFMSTVTQSAIRFPEINNKARMAIIQAFTSATIF